MSSESVKSKHGPARVAISVPRQFRERVRKSEVAFPEQERDRYVSRSLGYVVLLNGVAALILVAALAFAPQSTTDSHRLAWAMMVFGSGAMAGLLSSLFEARLARVGSGRADTFHRALPMRDGGSGGALAHTSNLGLSLITSAGLHWRLRRTLNAGGRNQDTDQFGVTFD
jgi:hypothetical protein